MKVLSLNFVNCAAKACKSTSSSFPLHPKDAELVQDEIELNPDMLINVLPRIDWPALRTTSSEVSHIFCCTRRTFSSGAGRANGLRHLVCCVACEELGA